MKKTFLFLTSLMVTYIIQAQPPDNAVMMYEQKISIPTYMLGAPEPNPVFYTPNIYQGAQGRVYPYPLLDKLTDEKVNKEYKGLFMENEYIKICILPELGGRLYMAQDKTNGYDFIYYNHVIKPSLIGMAGAWISGGVEWNVPHHHRVSTFMPVDYKLQENADGSKTIWVGEYEKRHGTKWMTGLTLRPGKSYIETTIKYHNVTPEIQSLLIWANMAVHANENYQVIFPPDVKHAVYHAKTEFTGWPISRQFYQGIDFTSGVDVSLWKNTISPCSFFAYESKMNFMGGIDHGKKAGTILTSDHHTVPGKKFWNWGNNDVARLWDQMLTDNDGAYLELMMGAYSDNQPDYSWCGPLSEKQATMYFFPSRDLTGIKNANKDFAINLDIKDQQAKIQVNATGAVKNIKLLLSSKGKTLQETIINIDPSAPYETFVKLPANVLPESVKLTLISEKGEELISYLPELPNNDPVPDVYAPPLPPGEISSIQELYLAGLRLEQFHNARFEALPYYFEALKRDSLNFLVNTQLGIHYLKSYDFEKAEKYLRTAVNTVTANFTVPKYSEPLYYLGVCLMNEEKFEEAADYLYKATWDHAWTSAASCFIAQMDSRNGDLEKALENINISLAADNENIEAWNLKATILRSLGKTKEALQAVNQAMVLDPLDFNGLYELYLLADGFNMQQARNNLVKSLRNEPDNYLETASRYGNAGFYSDAIQLLSLASASADDKLNNYPMIYYFLGYYQELAGDRSTAKENFAKGSSLPVNFCFPWSITSLKSLNASIKAIPGNANANYLLGCIYCDHQPEKALIEWQKASELKSNEAVYYRNMAFVYANTNNDINKAIEMIEKAIALNPNDPLYLVEADNYYGFAKVPPEKRFDLFDKHKSIAFTTDRSTANYLTLQITRGDYDGAIKTLSTRHFHSFETYENNLHVQWVDAHILRGVQSLNSHKYKKALSDFSKILEFPRNLEIAQDSKSKLAYYYMAKTYKAMSDKAKAAEYFTKSVGTYQSGRWAGAEWPEVLYASGMAYKELDQQNKADEVFKSMVEQGERILNINPHPAAAMESVERRRRQNHTLATGYYLIGLGNLGIGNKPEAEANFTKALETEPALIGPARYTF
jgi:tetratricopeptide (TPR) repeat protein